MKKNIMQLLKNLKNIKSELSQKVHGYYKLGVLGLLLLPYDSLPFFPMPTIYRPAWILPFAMLFIIHLFKKERIEKFIVILSLLLCLLLMQSFVMYNYYEYIDFNGFYKSLIVFVMFILGIGGVNIFIRYLLFKYKKLDSLNIISKILILSSIIPVIVGFVQIFSKLINYNLLFINVTLLFSYRTLGDRIQLVCGEPSWAAKYLIFIGVIVFLYYRDKDKKYYLYIYSFLLLFTGSSIGYLMLFIIVIFYMLLYMTRKIFIKALFIFSLIIIGILNYETVFYFSEYTQSKIKLIIDLSSYFTWDNILKYASIDGSFLARFLNPIIGFILGMEYPFGIGGEAFQYHYITMIEQLNIFTSLSDEKIDYLLGSGGTPKFLFSKLFAEYGILVFTSFFLIYSYFIYKTKDKNMLFLFIAMLCITYSFDSFLFYGFVIVISFIYEMQKYNYQKLNIIKGKK